MTTHAMIDLETLATDPHCTVLTVGGVKFNPDNNSEPHSEFYFHLDIDEQDSLGRTTTEDTIAWWAKQDPKVREEAFREEDRVGLKHFLDQLTKWMVGVDVLWGHGYGFDVTILEDLYRQMATPIPWNFWQVRDGRTLISILPRDPRKDMQTDLHNALADSYYQAKAIQVAYSKLYANINNTTGLSVNPSNSAAHIT
tara:strand:+ start:2389 stop:2979 length:591 start_codon:yes stop_codon:yes gene_type:complete